MDDILSYCGKKCFRDDKLKRIQYMYNLFNNFYIRDPILDVCNFQIKRYFEYKQFDYLVNNFIPNLKYKINGIPFFLIYKNSKELYRHVGIISKNDIIQHLN